MKRVLWPSVWLLVVALLAAGLSSISGLKFWWAFLIVAGAISVNGWVATLEDDLPGGFNNSDGTNTPRYAVITGWVVRGLGVVLAILCIIVFFLLLWCSIMHKSAKPPFERDGAKTRRPSQSCAQMTPDDFAAGFVDLYRRARELSVPCLKVTRARARSVSSDLEELVAAYVIANAENDLHIYVDQPVGIGEGKVAYPDLVVLDLKSNTVVAIVDVKTDIGWKRDGMQSMCEKLSRIRQALKTRGTVKLGPEPKARVPYGISENLSCHLVVGALVNSGNDLKTPEAMNIAKARQVQVYVLIEGKHPNDFSRQQGAQFPGMKVRTQDFSDLVSGASAA